MAFEAYLTQDQAKPTGRRRLTYTLSLAVHGALVLAGVVYSFWHVEELSPPTVHVTFLSAMPPPPPPPPPAGGNGGAKKKIISKPKPTVTPSLVQPKSTLVQPKEKPIEEEPQKTPKEEPKKTEDDDDDALPGGVVGGVKGGTAGGTIGGAVGGTVGGAIDAPAAAKILPPEIGKGQKVSGEDPAFPVALRKPGLTYVVMVKIYVDKTGAVSSVIIVKKADPQLDANVVSVVKNRRYRPFMANNAPVPFSYFERFEFKAD